MLSSRKGFGAVVVLILVVLAQGVAMALTPDEAVDLLATRLDQSQIKEGAERGLWPDEVLFLGPTTAGMACAYDWTGDPAYRAAAELAGDWIFWASVAQGNLFGDEAYAFVRLSEISDNPNDNVWRNALVDFYLSPRKGHNEDTTGEYLEAFVGLEPSTAVYYLAHHLVAADYVEDQDAELYRKALIGHLYQVSDAASFPIMALGVATWALAVTDTPAEMPIFAGGVVRNPYWEGMTVGDLPGLLVGHQVPEGELFAGSFYWRFDHTDGGTGGVVCGYTEDAIFGALGLVAAASKNTAEAVEEIDSAILAVQGTLLQGIGERGQVYEHVARQGVTYHTFAGEMLKALWDIEWYLARDALAADASAEQE